MKKIAAKLIEFGMNFTYDHNGSHGEIIQTYFGLEVRNTQGEISLENGNENIIMPVSEEAFEKIASRVEKICIEETSSF